MSTLLITIGSVVVGLVCSLPTLGQTPVSSQQENQKEHKAQEKVQSKSVTAAEDEGKPVRKVTLQLIFRSSGEVEVVKVLEVLPKELPKEEADELVRKSIASAKEIVFTPAMKNGRPVSQHVRVEYTFGTYDKKDWQK